MSGDVHKVGDNIRKGVVIGMPSTGRLVPRQWAYMLQSLEPPINWNHYNHVVEGKPVDEARNMIVDWAQKNRIAYIFFLGEDTVPPVYTLQRLIFLAENNPQIDVVGAMYWSKSNPPNPLVFRQSGVGSYWDWKLGELFKIWGIGMDATLIRVSAFDKIKKPYFLTMKADASVDGVNYAESWTEDLYFCDKLNKAGGVVMCDSSLQCDHYDIINQRVYSMPQNCRPAVRRAAVGKQKILDLGCGEVATVLKEGLPVRVDMREEVSPDYRADIRALPFKSESWDMVFSSHTLEHFARAKVPSVIDEWLRVLKPGGELRLILPDLKFAAKQILKGAMDGDAMNVLYGAQDNPSNFHRIGFTEQSIVELLKSKGMKIKKTWTEKPFNLFVSAVKPNGAPKLIGTGEGRRIELRDINRRINKGTLNKRAKKELASLARKGK
jgi:predicted SAM-dependent methyltransferase